MHRGIVQRLWAFPEAQKARGLFKGLGAYALHLLELGTGLEDAVGLPVLHDGLGRFGRQVGHIAQQGAGCGVQVNTHMVHTAFHNRI